MTKSQRLIVDRKSPYSICPQVCGKSFEERTDSETVDRRECTSVREKYEHDFVEFLIGTWRFSCSS
jgi:hypothetical protein